MSKKVYLCAFPAEKYEILQSLPASCTCTLTKSKNKAQKKDYLIYTYTLKQLPEKIMDKIIREIEHFSSYQQGNITVASKAYIERSAEFVKISLRIKSRRSKTLQQIIRANKYTFSPEQKIKDMAMLSETLFSLHEDRQPHGAISLSTITYKKSAFQLVLGPPVYAQIEKWKLREVISQQKSQQWRRPCMGEDVFSLGIVFLQLWLNQELPQNIGPVEARSYLSKIKDPNVRYIIQKMLVQADERWTVKQILSNTNIWESIKIASPQIPQPSFTECILNISLFDQIRSLKVQPPQTFVPRIQILKRLSSALVLFTMLEGRFFIKLTLQTGYQFFLDISEQIELIRSNGNLSFLSQQVLGEMLESPSTVLRLKSQGILQIQGYYLKQLAEPKKKQVFLERSFDKVCKILGGRMRMGCIITEELVLTSAWDLKDLKKSENCLSFQSSQYKSKNGQDCDLWIASEETEIDLPTNYDFCLISFNINLTLSYFSQYLQLVRNYSEQIIESKMKKLQTDLGFSYQLGRRRLGKGQLKFDKDGFKLVIPSEQVNFLSGEPLLINLPSGCCPVIGLYTAEGSGMLFTDSFYWALYSMIVKIRGEEEITSQYLPFIFVECSRLDPMEEELPNFNMKWINYFRASNGITREVAQARVEELEQGQPANERELCFYHFILFRILSGGNERSENDLEMSVFHLQRATACCCAHYQGRNNYLCALLQYSLGSTLKPISFDLQETTYFFHIAAETLREYGYNPFLFIDTVKSLKQLLDLNDPMRNSLQSEITEFVRRLGLIDFLKAQYRQILSSAQSGNQDEMQLQEVQWQLNRLETYSFSRRRSFDFEKGIKRVQKSIRNLKFVLIVSRLDELLGRNRLQGEEREGRAGRLKELWKSAIAVFMSKECSNRQHLANFEKLTIKYYEEEGYLSVRETFRQKDKILQQSL